MIKYLRSKACLCYIPVLLLTAVALTQLYLAHSYGLSPWAGGGFGWLLIAMGVSQSGERRKAVRYLYVAAFLLILVYSYLPMFR
jgi:hypothetical protein